MIPVPARLKPQIVLLIISADTVCAAVKVSSLILKTMPVIVAFCGTTTVFRIKLFDAVPSPTKWLLELEKLPNKA